MKADAAHGGPQSQAKLLNGGSQSPAAAADASVAGSPKHKQRKRKQPGGRGSVQQPAPAAQISEAARLVAADDAATRDPLSNKMLQSHAEFFDHLVELVPPRHYHDMDADRVSTKYMKKADRDAAKAAFRKQHKQNKRDKLDPDKAQTSLDVQKQLAAQAARLRADGSGADATGHAAAGGAGPAAAPPHGTARPALRLNLTDGAPREELQQRLAAKVAALREARHAEERARKTEAAKRFRATNGKPERAAAAGGGGGAKRKRADAAGGGGGRTPGSFKAAKLSAADFQKQLAEVGSVLSSGQKPAAKRPRPAEPADGAALSFGKLAVDTSVNEALNERKRRKRKESKAALLAKAEAKAAEKAAAADDPAAQAKAAGEAWGAAMARARGEKVLDDPTRLRRSLKKDAKAAAKRAGAWAERQHAQQAAQAERVKKRNENLQARVTAKQEKKKAKREKKLLRPGFEGRRSGFIDGGGQGK